MPGSEEMARITQQVVSSHAAPAHETPEAREYRDQTQQWLERMRRDAEHRGLNLVVEIPSDWPEL